MPLAAGFDPRLLSDAGWGVVFPRDGDPAVRRALSPLLELRRQQTDPDRYHELTVQRGDTVSRWLARHSVGSGPADPQRVPYYLLLVGGFEAIPYHFQAQLDVQYAVGRLHFDSPDAYVHYAQSVVAAEQESQAKPRRNVIFSIANPNDRHSALLHQQLGAPLVDALRRRYPDNTLDLVAGQEATKARLVELLQSDQGLGFLMTAGHGLAFPPDHPQRQSTQGALLCADWPGPQAWSGAIPPEFYLAADDLHPSMNFHGMIALLYASYSAATLDGAESGHPATRGQQGSAGPPFVSRLCQRLLTHDSGGALAVIGMSDVVRGSALASDQAPVEAAASIARRLIDGAPVGYAVEGINERYAELATTLTNEVEDIRLGKQADPMALAELWAQHSDARNLTLVGDPAVRLPASPRMK